MNKPSAPALPGPVPPAPVRPLPVRPDSVHRESPTGGGDEPGPRADPTAVRRARVLQSASILILCPVAGIGAVLSFRSLQEAAAPVFGSFAAGFPLLVDMLILGSMLAYLGGASLGRALPGWRWTAHGGVAGTLLLNALAASGPATIAWHITPPLVWSVLVEMTARQVTDRGSPTAGASEPIPVRIWFSSPLIAAGTWLQMARTGQPCHRQARADLAVHAAARHALRTALPQRRERGARRRIGRLLRAGALEPAAVLDYLRGRHQDSDTAHHTFLVLQAFLTREADGMIGVGHCGAHDSGAPGPSVRGTSRPGGVPAEAVPSTANGTRRAGRHPAGSRRSSRSPENDHQRRQAAAGILRTRPGIDGPQLARELTDQGWPVSARTARRILAQANHDVTRSAPDEQVSTNPGPRSSP